MVYDSDGGLTGDGTSSYLWAFDSWKKVRDNDDGQAPKQTPADFIYKLTPLAKLVFVLRNPTERSDRLPLFFLCAPSILMMMSMIMFLS